MSDRNARILKMAEETILLLPKTFSLHVFTTKYSTEVELKTDCFSYTATNKVHWIKILIYGHAHNGHEEEICARLQARAWRIHNEFSKHSFHPNPEIIASWIGEVYTWAERG